MSAELRELSAEECRRLIQEGGVGRVAFRSSKGLEIVPVNFQLFGDSIVFRTAPYTELGLHGPGRTRSSKSTSWMLGSRRAGAWWPEGSCTS